VKVLVEPEEERDYYPREEIDERMKALLAYLEKSATFIDFDLKTNGNAQRRDLINDLRRRFLS
jgi:hypothetical protein